MQLERCSERPSSCAFYFFAELGDPIRVICTSIECVSGVSSNAVSAKERDDRVCLSALRRVRT